MKVYVIEEGEYSDRHVIGVVSTEEKAKTIVNNLTKDEWDVVYYEAWEIDKLYRADELGIEKFVVIRDEDGEWCSCANDVLYWKDDYRGYDCELNTFFDPERFLRKGTELAVLVTAKDEDYAIKKAQDLYTKYLYENQLRLFYVWREGYACTGEYQEDRYLGAYEAGSFVDACKKAMTANAYSEEDIAKYYDEDNNTFWGCHFYEQLPTEPPKYFKKIQPEQPFYFSPAGVTEYDLPSCNAQLDKAQEQLERWQIEGRIQ